MPSAPSDSEADHADRHFRPGRLPPILAGPALQTGVFLFAGGQYTLVPNVQWLRIDYKEGPNPPMAEFKYIQDDNLFINLDWPSQFERLWPLDVPPSPYVLQADDRVVVLATNPDGSQSVLFDGFAQIPILNTTSRSQNVTFAAVGVAVRCFDFPIVGRVQRDSDLVGIDVVTGEADVQTDLPTRFNPSDTAVADGNKGGYLPNRCPSGFESDDPLSSGQTFPVFIDPSISYTPDPRAYWAISHAVNYVLAVYNGDEKYVKNPTFSTLYPLLQADYPLDDGQFFDPADDSVSDILVRDYDATNKPWPEAVSELLSYGGFVMRFDTDTNSDGTPKTDLKMYRRDAANPAKPKVLYLASPGDDLDPATSNVTGLQLARDCNSIANAWAVETSQKRVEASFLLLPLYQPATADLTAGDRKIFWASTWTADTTYLNQRKYRWYGVDELGEGYWSQDGDWVTAEPFDFTPLFPNTSDGLTTFTNRYRPAQKTLASLDSAGYPRKAELAIGFFNGGASKPQIWTGGGGPWQTIPAGKGWKLLDDRLGIEVTEDNPDEWKIGLSGGIVPGGVIRGITWWADPTYDTDLTMGLIPLLRLTCVIESDQKLGITAPMRTASPTKFPRWRVADARDHFQYNSVDKGSLYYQQDGGDGMNPYLVRDDTKAATTHAKQLRSVHEMPPLAGAVTIPYITWYYEVGDRLNQIKGRDANLTTNVGLDQGEAPEYPWIVGVSWTNDADRQQTILNLTDHRAEPHNL